jgi:hypothetical protein
MPSMQYRQGDVLLLQVSKLPISAKKESNNERIVLAYGELTGHAHAISNDQAQAYSAEGTRYLVVRQEAHLVHEEHATVPLPQGIYRVVRQREYSPQVVHYVDD